MNLDTFVHWILFIRVLPLQTDLAAGRMSDKLRVDVNVIGCLSAASEILLGYCFWIP